MRTGSREWTPAFGAILDEVIKRSALSVDQFARDMGRWFHLHAAELHGHAPGPGRQSLYNWIDGAAADSITFNKLVTLCLFVRYGRLGGQIDDAAWQKSRDMADAALTGEAEAFFRDFPIEQARVSADGAESVDQQFAERLIAAAQTAVAAAHDRIEDMIERLEDDPWALEYEFDDLLKGQKLTTLFDLKAEQDCREIFRREFGDDVQILGEESITKEAMWRRRYCVLIDAVDGTDIMAMGVNLWCSAIAILDRDASRIVACVIGLPSGAICSARWDEDGAWRDNGVPLSGCSDSVDIRNARVAVYGQKAKNLYAIATNTTFVEFLKDLAPDESARFRAFNFAGNNMIVRMSDRRRIEGRTVGEGIDAVIEPFGQRPHDCVPGLFLALKAGAYACDLTGAKIGYEELATAMSKPDDRVRYIVAGNKTLCDDVLKGWGFGVTTE